MARMIVRTPRIVSVVTSLLVVAAAAPAPGAAQGLRGTVLDAHSKPADGVHVTARSAPGASVRAMPHGANRLTTSAAPTRTQP